jgi:hypothetical protein
VSEGTSYHNPLNFNDNSTYDYVYLFHNKREVLLIFANAYFNLFLKTKILN